MAEHEKALNRRQALGLGIGSVAALTLPASAQPTPETEDVHDYEAYLDAQGIPQVSPAGTWEVTYKDVLGPFHLEGAPFRGKVTQPFEPGETLVVSGRVWGYDTKKPLPHTVIDVWQANAKGQYDMEDNNNLKPSEFRNRIRVMTDETGYYEYETIKSAPYRVGRGSRPAHIHYMANARNYRKLITQLYFKGDPLIEKDSTAKDSNMIVDLQPVETPHGTYHKATFDLVLRAK